MAGEYKTLARLFHADRSNDAFAHHERLARMRLEADSTFRTAIVTPLGEPFVAMPRSLSMVMERILLGENTISALWQGIPGVMRWDYIRHAISAEMFATNEMEGVRSTRKEVEDAVDAARAEADGSDAAPHKRATTGRRGSSAKRRRFVEFARLYLGLTEGSRPAENTRPADAAGSAEGSRPAETASSRTPRTLEDIRGIYDRVTHGEIDQDDAPDGALFRARDVDIVGPHGDAIHTGVNGEARISVMLTQMIDPRRIGFDARNHRGHRGAFPARIHPPVLRWQRQDRAFPSRARPEPRAVAAHRAVAVAHDCAEQGGVLQGVLTG